MGAYLTQSSFMPVPVLGRSAVFARERTVRCELRRWWVEYPSRWAAWLMLNPSIANDLKDDPTMLRVIHFTRNWGYDGCIVVNLYPFVSSAPAEMWARADWDNNGPDWYARDDMQANLQDIGCISRTPTTSIRIVAFGAQPVLKDQAWLEQCLEQFHQPSEPCGVVDPLYCLGTTKNGQPLHPMARGKWRVPSNQQPVEWRR